MTNWKMLSPKAIAIVLLVNVALLVDVARGQNLYCCDLELPGLCNWTNYNPDNTFKWTGIKDPDLTGITDFQTHTSKSGYYQNTTIASGKTVIADLRSPKVVLYDGDIISVEFYVHQSVADGSRPLFLYFDDDSARSTILVLTNNPGWNQPLSSYCGGSNLCCIEYPCSGKLRVHGEIKNPGDLLAFDNVQINGCPVQPTSEAPTTVTDAPPTTQQAITTAAPTETPTDAPTQTPTEPPTTEAPTSPAPTSAAPTSATPTPTPAPGPSSFCCSFETGCPDWSITGWTYSVDNQPNFTVVPPFTYGSQYAWNQDQDAGKIRSPVIYGVKSTSSFAFNYYAYSTKFDVTNAIIVYFRETNASSIIYLSILTDSNQQWRTVNVSCGSSCCVNYPCQGQLVFEASFGPGNGLYAVDNIEVNDGCVDSPKCCHFDDSDICGIINTETFGQWKWSGFTKPNTSYFPEFTSDGNYLWYQNYHVTTQTNGQVTLRTGVMTATRSSVFVGSFFVNNTDELYPLTVQFRRKADSVTTILEFVSDTYGVWHEVTMNCTSLHGDCCYPDDKCDGYLEVTGNVRNNANGDRVVFYGVDSINVDNECNIINN